MYKVLSLFSGIAGLCELGIAAAGLQEQFQVTQFVENNEYCQKVLAKRFPTTALWGDIRTFNPKPGEFDVFCGGFPCQNISSAGKREGIRGDRSGLFFEIIRLVRLFDRDTYYWRTWQTCLLTGWEKYSQSFPSAGTMQNGRLYQLPRWVQSTSANEFSLLRTQATTAKEVILSNGSVCLVSESDFDLVSQWKWKIHNGYASRTTRTGKEGVKWETILMHRLIAQAAVGEEVDHINRNKLDNRRENLRIVPHWVNAHNKEGQTNVRQPKGRNRWNAIIVINGVRKWLGAYATEAEALAAYHQAKKESGLMDLTTPNTQAITYLPTPKAQDGIHPGVANCKPGQTLHLSAAVMPQGQKRKLSVEFVEAMMGFPPSWTEI